MQRTINLIVALTLVLFINASVYQNLCYSEQKSCTKKPKVVLKPLRVIGQKQETSKVILKPLVVGQKRDDAPDVVLEPLVVAGHEQDEPSDDEAIRQSSDDVRKDNGQAYYTLGVFAYEEKNYKDAEAHLTKALQHEPDNPLYNHYMGKTFLKARRYAEAMRYLTYAWELDPHLFGLKYDMATARYKLFDYSAAAALFTEIVNEDPSNVLAWYYAGMSLFRSERYTKAADYFLQASEKNASVRNNAYYYAGLCYIKAGNIQAAAEKLEYVKEHTDSDDIRDYSTKWLQAVRKQKIATKPYSIYLKLGYQYDDNVILEPLRQEDIDDDTYEDKEDSVLKGYFSFRYDFLNQKKYQTGASYSHYQTLHAQLEEYDMTGSILNLYAKYRLEPFTVGIRYMPSYYWVDSDSFLMRHQIRPELTWHIRKDIVNTLSYSYAVNNYLQNNDSDGHTNEIFSDTYFSIGDEGGYFFWGFGYEDNSASHPNKDYAAMKTRMGILLRLPWEMNLMLTGRYSNKRYQNTNSVFGFKRHDIRYSGNVSFFRKLFYDWLDIVLDFDYTRNDSNIFNYDYRRKAVTLSLRVKY